MTPQKDHATLLEAFAHLPNKRDLKLLIVGDGPLRGVLQKRAEELGIANDVYLVGFRRDVFSILRMMEVFVFPSLWEGMATAIIEAMASERPVVASDIPPIREIVPSSDLGILVRPRDEVSLRRGIGLILEDRSLAEEMGKRAREHALRHFPIQKTVHQYQELFAEIERSKLGSA
jgi:glycosyltransferase involved in cell wall biosynthesis